MAAMVGATKAGTTDRIGKALLQEERSRLAVTTVARTAALAGVMGVVFLVTPFPDSLYYFGLIGLFMVAGIGDFAIARSRFARRWHKYAFAAFDAALLAFTLTCPNPFATLQLPPPLYYHFGVFIYFFILLGGLAFSFRPRLVLWGTLCGAVSWAVGVWWMSTLPGVFVTLPEELAGQPLNVDTVVAVSLDPYFIDLGVRFQEVAVYLIIGCVLAAVVDRSRRLVRRQAGLERRNVNLSRYFAPEIADLLAGRDEPFAAAEPKRAAVLFADIVAFTALVERERPDTVMQVLRTAHGLVEECVFRHRGVLDKFIGDGAMATFGAAGRQADDDVARAVACLEAILDRTDRWNAGRRADGLEPVVLSLGLHAGPVMVGDVGSRQRMELAVIGDTVNVAARLEHLTRETGVRALISQEVVDSLPRPPDGFTAIGERTVRGRRKPVFLWGRP